MNPWLIVAGASGLLAVVGGAYGYHWIDYDEAAQKDLFNMGIQYQMWHTLALLGVAALWARDGSPRRILNIAGICLALGTALFSGTLYVFGLTLDLIPGVAPTGGVLLMAGWATLIWAGIKSKA